MEAGGLRQKSQGTLMHHDERNDIYTDHLVAALGGDSIIDKYDANHPSWVAGTHIISVNI